MLSTASSQILDDVRRVPLPRRAMANLRGKRILCGAQPIPGHTIPVLRLATFLRQLGNEVLVLSFRENAELLRRHELHVAAVPSTNDVGAIVRRCLEVIDRFEPDVTVCDWLVPFHIAVKLRPIPCATSILRAEQFIGYRVVNARLPDKFRIGSPAYLSWFNGLLGSFGLPPVEDHREILIGDLILVPSVPELDPVPRAVGRYRDARVEYVGPLVTNGGATLPARIRDWIERVKRAGTPLVVVTLGTVPEGADGEIYRCVARLLSAAECAAILVVPHTETRRALAEEMRGEPRLRFVGFSNLRCLMEHSDLIIHHCGHGTALACLMSGVPSITLPSSEVDRADNAVRLERMGTSRRFDSDPTSARLHLLVREVLADTRMRERARRRAERVRAFAERTGVSRAARWMGAIVRTKERAAARAGWRADVFGGV